jgi:hypothetical protein
MTHREVIYPTAQHRINHFDNPCDGLEARAPEDDLEPAQQCRAFLHLGPIQWHPASRTTAHTPELKAQKAKTLTSRQIYPMSLFLVHLYFELAEFLAKSLLHRLS